MRRRRDLSTWPIWLLFSIGVAAIGLTGLAATLAALAHALAEVAHAVRDWGR